MKQYVFRDSEFMSAREKLLVQKAWVRFLKNGLRRRDFSDRLYKHLVLHFSFLGCASRAGFYAEYFKNGEDTLQFFSEFKMRSKRSWNYGSSWWEIGDHKDLNRAMIEEASPYIPALMEQASAKVKEADLADARRLAAKHGFQIQER